VDFYTITQKARVQSENRLRAIGSKADTAPPEQFMARMKERCEELQNLEDKTAKELREEIKGYRIWNEYLIRVKGIGPIMAAKLICEIDIARASRVSNLWAFAGLGLRNGKIQRPTKGIKLDYSQRLKTTCYLVARSMIMQSSPYRRVYDSAKEFYKANRSDWFPIRQDMAARRKMVKMFLSHLWVKWREMEGLPVSKPYVHEKMGHQNYMTAEEFMETKEE